MECIALKAAFLLPLIVLQKPHRSEAKDHSCALEHRLQLWKDSSFEALLKRVSRYCGYCHNPISRSSCQNCLYSLNRLLLLARLAAEEPTRNAGGLSITHGEQKQWWHACIAATQHRIITPTIAFQRKSTCSWRYYCLLQPLQLLLLLFSTCCSPLPTSLSPLSHFTWMLYPGNLLSLKKLFTLDTKACGGILL